MEGTLSSKKHAVVIGGVNMDICGSPNASLLMRDSNPGSVTVKPGGVGRNIAHDLRLMGMEVSLIAPIGGDIFGTAIFEGCKALGMDMSMAIMQPEMRSSTYLYVNDGGGDMFIAINEMDIMKTVTPERIMPLMARINEADAVVIDANLPPETVVYIAEHCTAPLYADAVSAPKAARLIPALGKLAALKPNALEAKAITGLDDPMEAAEALLKAGVRRVFVSMGGNGMTACEGDIRLEVPGVHVEVVSTTGAGDSVAAAIVYGGTHGYSLEETARLAVKAGAVTVASIETNAPGLADIV